MLLSHANIGNPLVLIRYRLYQTTVSLFNIFKGATEAFADFVGKIRRHSGISGYEVKGVCGRCQKKDDGNLHSKPSRSNFCARCDVLNRGREPVVLAEHFMKTDDEVDFMRFKYESTKECPLGCEERT